MKLFKNKDTTAMSLIVEGIVFTMIFNLYNPFIQMFAKRMGGNDMHTALLNAVPPLVAVFVLVPCGVLIEKINKKKADGFGFVSHCKFILCSHCVCACNPA